MKYLLPILFLVLIGCSKEDLFGEQTRRDLWLIHKGAKLPIVVEGNTATKVFVILLHGGPGGSAQEFNAGSKLFSDELEKSYAMVYYDQRNAGLSVGEWNEEKLTIDQHVEDLERVIDLLQQEYGNDIQLFLAGHSWGAYLGTTFLLDSNRQKRIKAWVNIDGLIHRNRNMFDVLERIETIANEQIANDINAVEWQKINENLLVQKAKSIAQYDVNTEGDIFSILNSAEAQINRDKVLAYKSSSIFSSIYSDNYDPFRIIITNTGDRDRNLRQQMYNFDSTLDMELKNINLPSLSIYGYYDVNTPLQQGEYFTEEIGTAENDKALVILNKSAHSSMLNEPINLANVMKNWIEKYR